MSDVLPKEVGNKFHIHLAKALQQTEMITFEYELTLDHGVAYFEARVNYLSKYQQLVVIIRDITEQHKAAELIRHQAYFDSLTLLPNRFLALDRLTQILNEAE